MFMEGPRAQAAPVRQEAPRHREALEALRTLDHAWAEEERNHLRRGLGGQEELPSRLQAVGQIALGIGACLMLPTLFQLMGFPTLPIQLLGLALILRGAFTLKRAKAYEEARDRYMDRRAELVNLREGI